GNGAGGELGQGWWSGAGRRGGARRGLPLLWRTRGLGADLRRRLGVLVRDLLLRDAGRALPTQARGRADGRDRGGVRPRPRPDPPALDPGLPADLRVPVVAALAAPPPRLPRLRP